MTITKIDSILWFGHQETVFFFKKTDKGVY